MRPWRTNVTVSKPGGGAGGSRHDLAVVHAPAVDAGEVLAEVAAGRAARSGPSSVVAGRVGVVVVDAEQERVDGGPLEPQRHGLEHGVDRPDQLMASGYGAGVVDQPSPR